MTSLLNISISKLSITVLYDAKTRNSFCWKYFKNIVIIKENNKNRILNPDQVYCAACLTAVKAESDGVTLKNSNLLFLNKNAFFRFH